MIASTTARRTGSRGIARFEPYLFIAPFYVLFAAFTLYPVLFALYMSTTNWRGSRNPEFTFLANYGRIVADETFLLAFVNNLWFSAGSIVLVIPLALGIAVLLNLQWLRFKGVLRTIYFLPIATSTVIVAMVFLALYDARYGAVNYLLGLVGVSPVNWLGHPPFVKPAIMGLIAWRWTGLIMVYFLAGLQSIPQDLYEAAMVDGASAWQSFRNVTIPLLRPVLLFVIVIVTHDSFRIFDEPYILNRFSMGLSGGPEDAGLSLGLYLYRMGFEYRQLGYASAIGVVIFLISFAVSMLQLRRFGIFRED